jgi:molybdate transport system substrate-binding protein
MAGPIPDQLQTRIGFTAALGSSAKEAPAGRALIRFLAAPEAAATLRAKGVDPI